MILTVDISITYSLDVEERALWANYYRSFTRTVYIRILC